MSTPPISSISPPAQEGQQSIQPLPTPPLFLPLIQSPSRTFYPRLRYHFADDPPLVPSPDPNTHTITLDLSSDLARISSARSFSPEYQISEVKYEECARIVDKKDGEGEEEGRSFRVVVEMVGLKDVLENREEKELDIWERVEKMGERWKTVGGVVGFGIEMEQNEKETVRTEEEAVVEGSVPLEQAQNM